MIHACNPSRENNSYYSSQGWTQHRTSKLVGSSIYCNWIQIRIQIVLLGFGVLRLAQHKEREGAGAAYLEDALVAGKGLGRRSPRRRRQGRKISSKAGESFFSLYLGDKGNV